MSVPLYVFNCMAHGTFDRILSADDPVPCCPHGCSASMVQKVITAPNFISDRTKASDNALNAVAQQHNLTNMTNKGGDTSMLNAMAQGGVNTRSMALDGGNMKASLASLGAPSDGGAFKQVAPMLKKPTPIVHAAWRGE